MANVTLRLGKFDHGRRPSDLSKFLAPFHMDMIPELKQKLKFRDEGNSVWRPLQEIQGNAVTNLQQFLKDAGFLPHSKVDGIFGYKTVAGTRLFQEYVRTIEGDASIGTPDGVAGPNTLRHIQKWKTEKGGTDDFVCKWGKSNIDNPSPNYAKGIAILERAKNHYLSSNSPVISHINQFNKKTDTRKVVDWDTSNQSIHLIGVRRNQDNTTTVGRSDDLFVLLIRGMIFCFWGSTDPNPGMSDRREIPYLMEGQHLYRFGWHKVSSHKKIYKALRPATKGVLVFRDKDGNKTLTDSDILNGLDHAPNTTINIHWSGIGRTNFSAGCQVIAGLSYLNNEGNLIDCSKFASTSYQGLGKGKTRGAYNVLSDLILCYAPPKVRHVTYTLGRDENAQLWEELNSDKIGGLIKQLRN